MTQDRPSPFDPESQPEEPLDPESFLDEFREHRERGVEDVDGDDIEKVDEAVDAAGVDDEPGERPRDAGPSSAG